MTLAEGEKRFNSYLKANNLLEKEFVIMNEALKDTCKAWLTEVGQIDDEEEEEEEEMQEQGKDKKEQGKAKTKKGETQNRVPKKRLFEVFQKTFSEIHEVHNLKTKTMEIK
jgi:hypothetical protein